MLLFDEIKKEIVDNEIKIEQMFIQNAILSEDLNNNAMWQQLANLEYSRKKQIFTVMKFHYFQKNII